MEPGTSRAAQELPELASLGAGVSQFVPDPEGIDFKGFPQAMAMVTMTDPNEIAKMMQDSFPETVGIQWAPDGTMIIRNVKTGAAALLNRPGISAMDVSQLLGLSAAYFPAGKVITKMASATGRVLAGIGASTGTEYGLQQFQEQVGGQFDALDVALSGALGPLAELGRPLITLGQTTGRFIGSYMPKNWFGGLEGVIPEAKKAALGFAKGAKDYLESGRKALMLTQDMLAETMKPYKQIIYKMFERLPFTGTGGLRATQRNQRMEVIRRLAYKYDLNPNTNYGKRVIEELNATAGEAMDSAAKARTAVIDTMKDEPVVLRAFPKMIGKIKNAELEFGGMANENLVKMLDNFRTTVWQGGGRQNYNRQFGIVNDFLERLYQESTSAPPAAKEAIMQVADALNDDLVRTARTKGGDLAKEWARASKVMKDTITRTEKKTLKAMIEAGEIDQQVMRKVLRDADPDQLTLMYNKLSPEGINAAQQMIMRNVLKVGGWRRGAADEATIDAKKVLNWMDSDAVDKQLQKFFPGKMAQEEIEGMRQYLTLTAAAQETGKGVGMAAAMGAAGFMALDVVTLGLLGTLGHTVQSAPVRNLLMRLHHVKGDKRAQDAIMEKLTPLALGLGRQVLQLWTESDPHDNVYVAEDPTELDQDADRQLAGKPTIDDLRVAAEQYTGPIVEDVSTRLQGMLEE
jgi:hypothetical protein